MLNPCHIKTPLPDGVLRLKSCFVKEAVSTLGEMAVQLLSEDRDIDSGKLLGKTATASVWVDDTSTREFSGYISRFSLTGTEGSYYVYQMTVRPWLWLLTRTSDCRIFQDMTVPDIVKKVFEDHSVADFDFKLFRSYRSWNYCVQYRETDYNFIARLLEHEGIYWYFTHEKGKHKLVLVDSSSAHDPNPVLPSLPFYAAKGQIPPDFDVIDHWSVSTEVEPGKVVMTDYDFERPSVDLQAEQNVKRDYSLSDGEIFDYPGGYIVAGDGKQYAENRIDEMQSDYEVFHGSANTAGVCAGHRLTLTRHPRDDQNAEYLVTATSVQFSHPGHEAASGEAVYRCDFGGIAAEQQFRPPRRTPKPSVLGPQTAVVVGPAGEELFTDKYGRVKVQFHWDREAKAKDLKDKSSCWVSVLHPWAGKNFGMVHIPRIGQEVVVGFLEGDPDRPIILGRTYNAEQMPPWDLPANATQSGILTRSSKGGAYDNANAIRFEDKKGSEQVWIHAEKNQDIEVENDETHWVGHDRKKTVDNDETVHVKHDRTENVDHDETITIGNDRVEKVFHDEIIVIGNDHTETIVGSMSATVNRTKTETVALNSAETVGLAKELTIGGLYQVTVGGAHNTTVGGLHSLEVGARSAELIGGGKSLTVGGDHTETVAGNQSLSIKKDRALKVDGKSDQVVKGEHTFKAKKIAITAEDELTITVGSAKLVMKKDGSILFDGKDINTKASGKVNVKASGDIILKGSSIKEN